MAEVISPQPKIVVGAYNFKGTNNDELCFCKGDLITVTQIVDGGWWEGTLNGQTGWFPANYVKEVKLDPKTGLPPGVKAGEIKLNKRESTAHYQSVVLQNIIDQEQAHVTELQELLEKYLKPLQEAGILSGAEYSQLCGNLEDITVFQENFLAQLKEIAKMPSNQQKVGGSFMMNAPQLISLYKTYCSNHPQAVSVLQTHREKLDQFMENQGAVAPGVITLTTSLSNPFRMLDRYPVLLKELERHIEDCHVDRGDTQRAIAVFRDIASSCTEIRKQKELELDIFSSTISGLEDSISQYGDVLLLSQVLMHMEGGEKAERLFILFPGKLIILSANPQQEGYTFESKITLSGTTAKAIEDEDSVLNAFEISGNTTDKIVVSCASPHEQKAWLDALRQQNKPKAPPALSTPPSHSHSHTIPAKLTPLQLSTSQPNINVTATLPAQGKKFKMTPQPLFKAHKTWSLSCLRPCPPLRPVYFSRDDPTKSPRSGRKFRTLTRRPERAKSEDDYLSIRKIDDAKTMEDALILKVIEAYCTSAKTRHTVNSSLLDSPHMLIAEEEKIIFEEQKGDQTVVEEKTLVDTVYAIKDQLKELREEQVLLRKELEEERRARKRIEAMLNKSRRSLRSLVDGPWEESSPIL
ncbi:rho guanine nucleotide exchange factor 7-like isoform X1 [Lingula anatina]|uniref:Rho guanine nucleotide exchange factor 7-like isoform X1 n=1 Tax=Lingula anatina TaxID=7574 RepID=A0A1S3HQA7_LINAN|nr:rho guanine nucleotide exchange factor 7-like isoform X1 [Lingula anatina]XP_013388222.1 rho guanine nucleotide exchange factor 7-like isoform X1 [Lingula anatina]|eukprot:XP_013388221.1 rho guanine nucleotide exchange factor 7-like isoform X1 [Lingula anatina]